MQLPNRKVLIVFIVVWWLVFAMILSTKLNFDALIIQMYSILIYMDPKTIVRQNSYILSIFATKLGSVLFFTFFSDLRHQRLLKLFKNYTIVKQVTNCLLLNHDFYLIPKSQKN